MKLRDDIIESMMNAFSEMPIDITKIHFLPDGLTDEWKKRLRKIADSVDALQRKGDET